MKELVQKIILYVLLFSIIKSLAGNEGYQKYIRFFGGICMVLLCVLPVLGAAKEKNWFTVLEKQLFLTDISEMEEKFQYSEAEFQDILKGEYEEAIGKEIALYAKNTGIELEDAGVTLQKKDKGYVIKEISCQRAEKKEMEILVQEIQIGRKQRLRREDSSKKAEKLRKLLCERFAVGEEQVHVWK